jgi:hypothetical protein
MQSVISISQGQRILFVGTSQNHKCLQCRPGGCGAPTALDLLGDTDPQHLRAGLTSGVPAALFISDRLSLRVRCVPSSSKLLFEGSRCGDRQSGGEPPNSIERSRGAGVLEVQILRGLGVGALFFVGVIEAEEMLQLCGD